MATTLAAQIELFAVEFRRVGTKKSAAGQKRYLKSELNFFGVTMPDIRRMAKTYRVENPTLTHRKLISLVRALWRTPYHEHRVLGIALLAEYPVLLGPDDLLFIEALLNKSYTWAEVDWLASGVAGDIVARYPKTKSVLRRWAKDPNFWVRRSSMLALLLQLRAGTGDFELFASFARPMLHEKEFFIRKAIGWVLRSSSRKRPELTHAFLVAHIHQVSGLTFREGSRRLPLKLRKDLERRRA